MDLSKVNWSSVLDGLGTVATVFNPVVGKGLMVASDIADKLESSDVLENNVIGITRCVELLDDMILKGDIDMEKLSFLSSNLKSTEDVLTKLYKAVR